MPQYTHENVIKLLKMCDDTFQMSKKAGKCWRNHTKKKRLHENFEMNCTKKSTNYAQCVCTVNIKIATYRMAVGFVTDRSSAINGGLLPSIIVVHTRAHTHTQAPFNVFYFLVEISPSPSMYTCDACINASAFQCVVYIYSRR